MKSYEYTHVIGFAETNFLGNVYYVNHLAWQGRCREMFLRDLTPSILDDLKASLRMVTIRCNCEYFHELAPFDVVIVRMRLGEIIQNRVTMLFEYWRRDAAQNRASPAARTDAAGPGAANMASDSRAGHFASAPHVGHAAFAPNANPATTGHHVGRNDPSQPVHETLVARGEQQIGCMLLENGRLIPAPVPQALRDALKQFGAA